VNEAAARVLGALRSASGPCSGEDLSAALGVSRAQVWKHVEQLRKRGYQIEGEPGGGYRLEATPDRLYPEAIAAHLETRWLAQTIEHLEETDSTNRVANERGAEGAEHGYTVVAEAQTAGRGRLGRSFFSPPHRNLYTSSILRPQLDTSAAPTLIPSAAIAVADTLTEELGARDGVAIKWPNDLLLGGRKTCGILMEMHAEDARVGHLVLGIGVNLNSDPSQFPEEFREQATSLSAFAGRPIDRISFAARLYSRLEAVLDEHARGGFARLRARYEDYFQMSGRRVGVVQMDGSQWGGVAAGVDDEGMLLVDRDDGVRARVVAGDVTLAKDVR
jgi:BirA family biotin operon repressor/biotin-[acetyl-CoA-carboxylase] ligase